MKGRKWIGIIAAVMVFRVSAGLATGPVPTDKTVLRGIREIGVSIGELPHSARKAGITRRGLRSSVADKLRSAGIPVVTEEELKADPDIPRLLVSVLLGYTKTAYMYTVLVGINEKVRIKRDTEIVASAMPWWRVMKGENAGGKGLKKDVLATLVLLLDEFVDDYFAVNPKSGVERDGGVLPPPHRNDTGR